jgi:hypothetical protein
MRSRALCTRRATCRYTNVFFIYLFRIRLLSFCLYHLFSYCIIFLMTWHSERDRIAWMRGTPVSGFIRLPPTNDRGWINVWSWHNQASQFPVQVVHNKPLVQHRWWDSWPRSSRPMNTVQCNTGQLYRLLYHNIFSWVVRRTPFGGILGPSTASKARRSCVSSASTVTPTCLPLLPTAARTTTTATGRRARSDDLARVQHHYHLCVARRLPLQPQ